MNIQQHKQRLLNDHFEYFAAAATDLTPSLYYLGSRLSAPKPHTCTAIGWINLHMNDQWGFCKCKISFITQGTFQIEGITTSLMSFISMIGNGSADSNWTIRRSEIFPPVFMVTAWLKTESRQSSQWPSWLHIDLKHMSNLWNYLNESVNEGEDE